MALPAGEQQPLSNVPFDPTVQQQHRSSPSNPRKRQRETTTPLPVPPPAIAPAPALVHPPALLAAPTAPTTTNTTAPLTVSMAEPSTSRPAEQMLPGPPAKKGRTNTPWTPAEEQRLKLMRDEGKSWSEIAKAFPLRTEGSVKKHWYKDMHYAEFAEDESAALLAAIKEYEANKWKAIGQKVGKPAKACEQYAKEHGFIGKT